MDCLSYKQRIPPKLNNEHNPQQTAQNTDTGKQEETTEHFVTKSLKLSEM